MSKINEKTVANHLYDCQVLECIIAVKQHWLNLCITSDECLVSLVVLLDVSATFCRDWCSVCVAFWCFSMLYVSEVLGEAGRGFAACPSCAGPHTCST